ncbi:MAG: bifunctional 2-polyprenyl-6-hydroxyphenol methylase/3-demethylubiquinol 3-O-methyltransferase UbiG [Dehalococcoidia bacterium]|nr:bifunctional 2-polyprenyl-6-hydroxyphenol methylase/3-demethylubiquinol 3-O-methyltransferase UbiG [Dehalococcoidia bacterium]
MTPRSVFDSFPWWDTGDVLTQITPSRFEYIRSVLGNLAGRQVLDLGCGGGLLSEPLARAGARVEGVDLSLASLSQARRHAEQGSLHVHYSQAQAEALPYKDDSFDTVIAFDVLEHLSNLGMAIEEVSRVLRPGGRLIYDTMNRTFISRVVVIWIGENLWKGGPPKGTHAWGSLIPPKRLLDLLCRNGIADIEMRGFLPLPDLKGRLRMRLSPFKGISYAGYGVKLHQSR